MKQKVKKIPKTIKLEPVLISKIEKKAKSEVRSFHYTVIEALKKVFK